MADAAEQERKAKAERAKKLLAAQKKKKKAAAAAAAGLADTASQAASSEAGGSPRPSIDERRPTPLATSTTESAVSAEEATTAEPAAVESKPATIEEEAEEQPPAAAAVAPAHLAEQSDGDAVERVLESGTASVQPTPDKKKRKGKGSGEDSSGQETDAVAASEAVHPSVAEIQSLRATIDKLTGERDAATRQITALESTVSTLRTDVGLLAEARTELARVEAANQDLTARLAESESRLAELDELRSARDDAEAKIAELERQRNEQDRRVQELSGRVDKAARDLEDKDAQAKQQVEEVEARLSRQRDREGGLEAEVIRLKQLHAESSKSAQDGQKALEDLRKDHQDLQGKHDESTTKYQALVESHEALQKSVKDRESASARAAKDLESARAASKAASSRADELQETLARSSAEVKSLQGQLAQQTKRADQATNQRKGLQEDNVSMMAQLEEIKGRLAALTDEKVGLIEAKEAGEKAVADLEALRAEHSATQTELETLRDQAAQHSSAQDRLEQSQAVASESEATINSLRKDIQDLQLSVDAHNADLAQARESTAAAQAEALSSLRVLAASAGVPADEDADVSLLTDLLREKLTAPSVPVNGSAAHDDDPAERDLELSGLAARLRTVESALHEETTRTHALSRQLTDMQAEMAQALRDRDEALRLVEQGVGPSRSAGSYGALDRRIASPPPVAAIISPRAPVDYDLPPSVRHKRHVSLQALRARMGQAGRDDQRRPSMTRAPNSGVSSLKEDDEGAASETASREGSARKVAANPPRHRQQYGDEVVFWCPCCTGDLISL